MSMYEEALENIKVEFLKVAIHHVLYASRVYPDHIYATRKKYGVPVKFCAHPRVQSYVTDIMKVAQHLIKYKKLQKIEVRFYDHEKNLTCLFTFKLSDLVFNQEKDPYMFHLEEALRAFCLQLESRRHYLKKLSESFKIALIVTQRTYIELKQNPRMQHPQLVQVLSERDDVVVKDFSAVPMSEVPKLGLQMYVQLDYDTN